MSQMLEIHQLDPGTSGDCCLILFKDGDIVQDSILIDGSYANQMVRNKKISDLIDYIKLKLRTAGGKADKLHNIIITHFDEDHYCGIFALLKTFGTDDSLVGPETTVYTQSTHFLTAAALDKRIEQWLGLEKKDSDPKKQTHEEKDSAPKRTKPNEPESDTEPNEPPIGCKHTVPELGSSIGEYIKFISVNGSTWSGPIQNKNKNTNTGSLGVIIEFEDFRFYTAGDLTNDVEKRVADSITKTGKPVNVMKLSHHGSNSSTPEELLHALNPEYALISFGPRYNHPDKEVIERLNNFAVTTKTTKGEQTRFKKYILTGKREQLLEERRIEILANKQTNPKDDTKRDNKGTNRKGDTMRNNKQERLDEPKGYNDKAVFAGAGQLCEGKPDFIRGKATVLKDAKDPSKPGDPIDKELPNLPHLADRGNIIVIVRKNQTPYSNVGYDYSVNYFTNHKKRWVSRCGRSGDPGGEQRSFVKGHHQGLLRRLEEEKGLPPRGFFLEDGQFFRNLSEIEAVFTKDKIDQTSTIVVGADGKYESVYNRIQHFFEGGQGEAEELWNYFKLISLPSVNPTKNLADFFSRIRRMECDSVVTLQGCEPKKPNKLVVTCNLKKVWFWDDDESSPGRTCLPLGDSHCMLSDVKLRFSFEELAASEVEGALSKMREKRQEAAKKQEDPTDAFSAKLEGYDRVKKILGFERKVIVGGVVITSANLAWGTKVYCVLKGKKRVKFAPRHKISHWLKGQIPPGTQKLEFEAESGEKEMTLAVTEVMDMLVGQIDHLKQTCILLCPDKKESSLLDKIDQNVIVKKIKVDHNMSRLQPSKISVKVGLRTGEGGLELLKSVSLKEIGVCLRVDFEGSNDARLADACFSGNLYGDLEVRCGRTYTLRNKLYFQSRDLLMFELTPSMDVDERFDLFLAVNDLLRAFTGVSLNLRGALKAMGIHQVTIDGLQVGIDPRRLAEKRVVSLALQNSVVLFGYRFNCDTKVVPSFTFSGTLSPSEKDIRIAEILEKIGITSNDGIRPVLDSRITLLSLYAFPSEGTYSLTVRVEPAENVEIVKEGAKFKLERIEFQLMFVKKKLSKASISAMAEICGSRVDVVVRYSKVGGWEFYLSVSDVKVKDLFGAIMPKGSVLGNASVLEDDNFDEKAIKDTLKGRVKDDNALEDVSFNIKQIVVYVATKKRHVSFQLKLEFKWKPCDWFSITPRNFYIQSRIKGSRRETSVGINGLIALGKESFIEGSFAIDLSTSSGLSIDCNFESKKIVDSMDKFEELGIQGGRDLKNITSNSHKKRHTYLKIRIVRDEATQGYGLNLMGVLAGNKLAVQIDVNKAEGAMGVYVPEAALIASLLKGGGKLTEDLSSFKECLFVISNSDRPFSNSIFETPFDPSLKIGRGILVLCHIYLDRGVLKGISDFLKLDGAAYLKASVKVSVQPSRLQIAAELCTEYPIDLCRDIAIRKPRFFLELAGDQVELAIACDFIVRLEQGNELEFTGALYVRKATANFEIGGYLELKRPWQRAFGIKNLTVNRAALDIAYKAPQMFTLGLLIDVTIRNITGYGAIAFKANLPAIYPTLFAASVCDTNLAEIIEAFTGERPPFAFILEMISFKGVEPWEEMDDRKFTVKELQAVHEVFNQKISDPSHEGTVQKGEISGRCAKSLVADLLNKQSKYTEGVTDLFLSIKHQIRKEKERGVKIFVSDIEDLKRAVYEYLKAMPEVVVFSERDFVERILRDAAVFRGKKSFRGGLQRFFRISAQLFSFEIWMDGEVRLLTPGAKDREQNEEGPEEVYPGRDGTEICRTVDLYRKIQGIVDDERKSSFQRLVELEPWEGRQVKDVFNDKFQSMRGKNKDQDSGGFASFRRGDDPTIPKFKIPVDAETRVYITKVKSKADPRRGERRTSLFYLAEGNNVYSVWPYRTSLNFQVIPCSHFQLIVPSLLFFTDLPSQAMLCLERTRIGSTIFRPGFEFFGNVLDVDVGLQLQLDGNFIFNALAYKGNEKVLHIDVNDNESRWEVSGSSSLARFLKPLFEIKKFVAVVVEFFREVFVALGNRIMQDLKECGMAVFGSTAESREADRKAEEHAKQKVRAHQVQHSRRMLELVKTLRKLSSDVIKATCLEGSKFGFESLDASLADEVLKTAAENIQKRNARLQLQCYKWRFARPADDSEKAEKTIFLYPIDENWYTAQICHRKYDEDQHSCEIAKIYLGTGPIRSWVLENCKQNANVVDKNETQGEELKELTKLIRHSCQHPGLMEIFDDEAKEGKALLDERPSLSREQFIEKYNEYRKRVLGSQPKKEDFLKELDGKINKYEGACESSEVEKVFVKIQQEKSLTEGDLNALASAVKREAEMGDNDIDKSVKESHNKAVSMIHDLVRSFRGYALQDELQRSGGSDPQEDCKKCNVVEHSQDWDRLTFHDDKGDLMARLNWNAGIQKYEEEKEDPAKPRPKSRGLCSEFIGYVTKENKGCTDFIRKVGGYGTESLDLTDVYNRVSEKHSKSLNLESLVTVVAFSTISNRNLSTLILDNNAFGGDKSENVANAMLLCTSLTDLGLMANNLGQAQKSVESSTLAKLGIGHFVPILERNKSLTRLCLNSNHLKDTGLELIKCMLVSLTQLKCLQLADNKLTDHSMLLEVIQQGQLERLDISFNSDLNMQELLNHDRFPSRLKALSLAGNQNLDGILVEKFKGKISVLERLNLSKSSVNVKLLEQILQSLSTSIQQLDLSYLKLSDADAALLIKVLKKQTPSLTNLRKINFAQNDLGKDSTVTDALFENDCFVLWQEVDLSNNVFESSAVEALKKFVSDRVQHVRSGELKFNFENDEKDVHLVFKKNGGPKETKETETAKETETVGKRVWLQKINIEYCGIVDDETTARLGDILNQYNQTIHKAFGKQKADLLKEIKDKSREPGTDDRGEEKLQGPISSRCALEIQRLKLLEDRMEHHAFLLQLEGLKNQATKDSLLVRYLDKQGKQPAPGKDDEKVALTVLCDHLGNVRRARLSEYVDKGVYVEVTLKGAEHCFLLEQTSSELERIEMIKDLHRIADFAKTDLDDEDLYFSDDGSDDETASDINKNDTDIKEECIVQLRYCNEKPTAAMFASKDAALVLCVCDHEFYQLRKVEPQVIVLNGLSDGEDENSMYLGIVQFLLNRGYNVLEVVKEPLEETSESGGMPDVSPKGYKQLSLPFHTLREIGASRDLLAKLESAGKGSSFEH